MRVDVVEIRPFQSRDTEGVIRLSLRACAPVFPAIEAAMDHDVYIAMHPDWRVTQRDAVAATCADESMQVWVAVEDGISAGFVAVKLHPDALGEIYMLAVDPDYQRQGIAAALTEVALAWMKQQGVSVAMVQTGGDPGHAPARAAYEKFGFRALPSAQYFKKL